MSPSSAHGHKDTDNQRKVVDEYNTLRRRVLHLLHERADVPGKLLDQFEAATNAALRLGSGIRTGFDPALAKAWIAWKRSYKAATRPKTQLEARWRPCRAGWPVAAGSVNEAEFGGAVLRHTHGRDTF